MDSTHPIDREKTILGNKMPKKKVMVIFGTRPDAIKMAPVIAELKTNTNLDTVLVSTGQHREMLDQALSVFRIQPDYDLDIMTPNQSLEGVTCNVLNKVGGVIEEERPDLALVHGDTSTAFASALSAYYHRIPVGHVEAGLYSYDPYNPCPEEMNRKLISDLATFHFTPTEKTRTNLIRRGVDQNKIYVTGNPIADAVKMVLKPGYRFRNPILQNLSNKPRRILLATAHRRENWGDPLENICLALKGLVSRRDDIEIVYPLHPHPKVEGLARRALHKVDRINLTTPLSFEEFLHLERESYLVLTDSGGLQEEAPCLKKPVLVLRGVTEREDGLESGAIKLVGTLAPEIIRETERLLDDPSEYRRMASAPNPYGEEGAAEKIASHVGLFLAKGDRKYITYLD